MTTPSLTTEALASDADVAGLFREAVRAMQAYVPGEQPQDGQYLKLNTNENPYPPPPGAVQAIINAASGRLERYPDPLGTAFRKQAAAVLGVEPDWILCGNGSDDILTIVTRALVGEGDRLRLPYPSYILYRTLAQLQGASWEEVHFRSDFTLDARFAANDERLKLVFLPNPNSPSGTLISPAEIAELAERLDCPILVDEAYVDFAETNCIDLVKQNPRIMVSRTFSKSYALAGLRFGFLVAQPAMIRTFRKVKDSYNCDALSLAGATAAIADQAWLADNRAKIIATRAAMTARLRKLGFTVTDSHANFVWCTSKEHSAQRLYEGLKAQKVLVRYMNYAGWGDGLRISVGTDEGTETCLNILESLL
ncbi:MAG: histidinol-phosphate transaminase [Aureliella sp.]